MRRVLKSAILLFLCSLILIPAITYAWVSYSFPFSDTEFAAGELQPQNELYYWDKSSTETNKWKQVVISEGGESTSFYPDFGGIDDLSTLPAGLDVYLKIKVSDVPGAVYKWKMSVSDVDIQAIRPNGTLITANSQNHIGQIDYFASSAENSQKCIYYSAATGGNDLTPTVITYGASTHLATEGQILSGGFLPQNVWLYLHVELSITELQNILRCIPVNESPYTVKFKWTVIGEGRTVDNE